MTQGPAAQTLSVASGWSGYCAVRPAPLILQIGPRGRGGLRAVALACRISTRTSERIGLHTSHDSPVSW